MLILAGAIVEMGHIDGALLIRFSGWLRIAVPIGNYDRLENTPNAGGIAERSPCTGPVPQRKQDSGQL